MENKKKAPRTEYLSMATIVIVIALVMVIIMIATSGKNEPSAASSSVESSAAESSVPEESTPDESSEAQKGTVYIEVKSASRLTGPVAITRPGGPTNVDTSELVSVYSKKNDTFGLSGSALRLSEAAMNAFNDMTKAFTDIKGKTTLVMHKGYTPASELTADDAEKQADLTTGSAVWLTLYPADRDGDTLGTGKFIWLVDNCNTYGFILRYPAEKSQYTGQEGNYNLYRFVGYTHAAYIGKYHYSLEEYLNNLKQNASYENPASFDAGMRTGDRPCILYYVAASDAETTQIPIPEGSSGYEVSGNGSDGFIVIVYQ